MVEITRENPNAFKTLADKLDALEGVVGKAGWFEGSTYPDGTPVAYVAAIQELGSPANNIPSRSYMRTTVAEQEKAWGVTADKVSALVLSGKMSPADAMEILAAQAAGDMRKKIASITAPPLSQLTLGVRKYKKLHPDEKITGKTLGKISRMLDDGSLTTDGVSEKPLVDTTLMITTLTHTVETVQP